MKEAQFAELKANILRTILARRITLGIFATVALVVKMTSRISYLNPLFYSPLAWFFITFPFKYLIERQQSERRLHWVHTGFFAAEIVLITLFVHLMGGSEWIGIIFYLFTVIYANFFLPPVQGYLVTALVITLYSLLVFLEYAGMIGHRSLFTIIGAPYRSLSYNLATVLAGAVGIYATLAFTVRSFTEIYRNKTRALGIKEAQLARLSKRLLSVQDEERRRIAQELHDRLGQSLTAIKLHLATLKGELNHEKEEEIMEIIDNTIEQTRSLAYSLRPPLLDNLGLNPSLYRLTEMVKSESGLEINLSLEEGKRLPTAIEGLLFYVTQEALKNTATHAQAKQVNINLLRPPGSVILSIEDDGIGFRPKERQGLGIAGIKQRVEMSGGKIQIRSSPGKGTGIKVQIPHGHNSSRNR
jgi:signal transduction histidine kinase